MGRHAERSPDTGCPSSQPGRYAPAVSRSSDQMTYSEFGGGAATIRLEPVTGFAPLSAGPVPVHGEIHGRRFPTCRHVALASRRRARLVTEAHPTPEMTMHTERTPRPRLLRTLVALPVVAVVATATLLVPGGADAAEPKALFEQIGTLERFPADARAALGEQFVPQPDKAHSLVGGTMITVPQARLLLQLYHSPNVTTTAVVVRDLDSFRLLRTLRLAGGVDRATTLF